MAKFSIEGFAKGCKAAMAHAEDRCQAAREYLEKTLQENSLDEISATLDAAIPKDADVGEMMVYTSAELTLLYGRVPPHFQSGIHNHTVFACIGQLNGAEMNTFYEKSADGHGLKVITSKTVNAGEVISMPADAIHHIENPNEATSCALHVYGGDFNAVMDDRSLWSCDDHEEKGFTFKGLLGESIKGMKLNQNAKGLQALVKAIPSVKAMIDA